MLSAAVWTGAAGDGNWSDISNWQNNLAPTSGQPVTFPNQNNGIVTINVNTAVTVGDIDMQGNYRLVGSGSVTVNGQITAEQPADEIGKLVLGNVTTVLGAGGLTIDSLSGGFELVDQSTGLVRIVSCNGYTSPTEVDAGTLSINGQIPSDVKVSDNVGNQTVGALEGNGQVKSITVRSGQLTLAPYTLTSSNGLSLDSSSTLNEQISFSTSPAYEADGEVDVTGGTISLGNATLNLAAPTNYNPAYNQVITLISNQTGRAISGTFTGLPEGAWFNKNGVAYQISYVGGTSGRDVTLLERPEAVWTGASDTNWSNPGNWASGELPAAGQSVYFPNDGGNLCFVDLNASYEVGTIFFAGNYEMDGGAITLDGDISSTPASGTNIVTTALVLTHNTNITIGAGSGLGLNSVGDGGHHYGITQAGGGSLIFAGTTQPTYTGATTVTAGTLELSQRLASAVTLDAGTTLESSGSTGPAGITDNGGTIELGLSNIPSSPSVSGPLSMGNGATLQELLSSQGNIETDGELVANGSGINVTGATLSVTAQTGFIPSPGDVITVIKNNTHTAITGTFASLPEGQVITVSGVQYQISYKGGASGHDVTLSVLGTATSTGGDGNWNNAANWAGDATPAPGQSVKLTNTSSGTSTSVQLASPVTVGDLTLVGAGSFAIKGSTLTLDGNLSSSGASNQISSGLVLTHNTTITGPTGDTLTLGSISDGGNGYGITLVGGGTLRINGPATYTGATEVSAGTLDAETVLHSPVTVDPGNTLEGNGTVAGLTSNSATISLGSGGTAYTLKSTAGANLENGSTLNEPITATSAGELIVTSGSINLTNCTLNAVLQQGVAPPFGDTFTLISNQTGSPVIGTFSGFPNGTRATINGAIYQINYAGGASGNDVTLTLVSLPPDVWSGGGDHTSWNDPNNWQGNKVPLAAQWVEFPDLGSQQTITLAAGETVGDITLQGAYSFQGNQNLAVDGNISDTSQGDSFSSSVLALGPNPTTVDVEDGDALILDAIVSTAKGSGIIKTGNGTLYLGDAGTNASTGSLDVQAGIVQIEAPVSMPATIDAGGTLSGSGSVPTISANGGTLALASTLTSAGNVALARDATFDEVLSGTGSSVTLGKLVVSSGTINLQGANLRIDTENNFVPGGAQVITLISNKSGKPISGTFNSLPEGSTFTENGVTWQISYVGGASKHDVTITPYQGSSTSVTNPSHGSSGTGGGTGTPAKTPPGGPTVASLVSSITTTSPRPKLSIVGTDPGNSKAVLTYTWSVVSAPPGAKPVKFEHNGTAEAANQDPRFSKAGTYVLNCTVANSAGQSTTAQVTVHILQVPTLLRLTPHGETITDKPKRQLTVLALDQFNHPMNQQSTISYQVLQGDGNVNAQGVFTAGKRKGHVIVEVGEAGLIGYIGFTIT